MLHLIKVLNTEPTKEDEAQEAIFVLRKDNYNVGDKGNTATLYAYLTQQKTWIELSEYETKEARDITTKLMIGIEYESGQIQLIFLYKMAL